MKELFRKIQPYSGKIFAVFLILFFSYLAYNLYNAPVDGFEEKFVYLLKKHGYIILFAWGMLEGEAGLIMAGLLSHTGDMNLYIAIFVAGLGGFMGDQVYFYIGRFNKSYVHKKFKGQRRKFAFAHLLLQKVLHHCTATYPDRQSSKIRHWEMEQLRQHPTDQSGHFCA